MREISFVDPTSQTTTISSVNLSLAQFAVCNEMIRYSPNGSNRTKFSQTAEIETRVEMWRSVADRFEGWLASRFEQNAEKGKEGFTDVLSRLWRQDEPQPA